MNALQKPPLSRASRTRRATMRPERAVEAMMALAHETRLAAFRILMRAGPGGLSAGAIATRLQVMPSTLSHHLAVLERADLLDSWRQGQQIFYACDYSGIRGVIDFLINDCCRGHPDFCGLLSGPPRADPPTKGRSARPRRNGGPRPRT